MNRLKQLREEKKITQEELAKQLGLSKGIISLYEKEERKPSLEVITKLCNIFDCSMDYLMGNSNSFSASSDKLILKDEVDSFNILLRDDILRPLSDTSLSEDDILNIPSIFNLYSTSNTEKSRLNYLRKMIDHYSKKGATKEEQDKIHNTLIKFFRLKKEVLENRLNRYLIKAKNVNSYIYLKDKRYTRTRRKRGQKEDNIQKCDTSKQYYMCPLYNEILSEEPYWLDNNIKGRIVLDTNIYNINKKNDYFSIEVNENYTNFRNTYGHYIIFQKQNSVKDDDIILAVIENSKPCIRKYKKLSDTLVMLQPIDSTDVLEPLVIDITNTAMSILGTAIGYFGKMETK